MSNYTPITTVRAEEILAGAGLSIVPLAFIIVYTGLNVEVIGAFDMWFISNINITIPDNFAPTFEGMSEQVFIDRLNYMLNYTP